MRTDFIVDDVHAGYGDVEILSGVSFRLDRSEFVGMIGPNGSGKTTLLRAMSRVLAPKTGAIRLQDDDIYSIPAREFAKRVAVVPQETLVAFDFSVLEIVLMGRSPRLGRFSIEGHRDVAIALDALGRTGTAHLKDRQITALSGGERQRVMIARALAQEPEALLLDEPTSHLDISFQFEIMDLIKSLNRERGMTILAVLHDLNLASQYCDRLIMLGQGKVFADGSAESVVTSDNIRRVYSAEVWVRRHPVTARPYVISGIRGHSAKQTPIQADVLPCPKIHIIGGGGTAAPALAKLMRRGYAVTCGVLSIGDADQEVADALDIPYVPERMFESISAESSEGHRELMQTADVVLLMNMPVGHGNLANVEIALQAALSGKLVIAIDQSNISKRDFTGGKASALFDQILSAGCKPAKTLDQAIGIIEDYVAGI